MASDVVDRVVPQTTLDRLFDRQTAASPDDVALTEGGHHLTYRQLLALVNQWTRFLLSANVKRGDRVAVAVDRSAEAVAILLAVMKAGAAYVPIDTALPPSRRAAILDDSDPALLVSSTSTSPSARTQTVTIDEASALIARESTADPDCAGGGATCCVLYTSGVTGRPKGVVISHAALLNHFEWMWRSYAFAADDVALIHRSYALMAACWDYFGPLLRGTRSVVVPESSVPDLRLILRTATEQRVTHVSGAPSTWRGLLDQPAARLRQWRTLRLGITSGEPIPPDLVWSWRRAFPSARLLNLYGLTECVRPLAFDTSRLSAEMTTVPLGDPTPNATIFVLDETGASVEDGTIGEIGVAGPCLADGYLRRPELTAERFVSIELADASTVIVFKTGDRGRLRPDGLIELIGREDNQVKIRGFRVELGDVEATLRRVDGVRDVAVVVEDRGLESARLVAYMSMRTAHQVSSEDVRAFLRRELPEYMVPAQCVIVDALPLTASGKVDRVRLSVGRRPAADQPIASPDPATAQRLARIWSDVIGMPNVAVTANFLELGGHSLQATRIAARVSDELAVDLDMALFLSPTETVQSMADTIDRHRTFLLTLTSATSARN